MALDKLIQISSPRISAAEPTLVDHVRVLAGPAADDLSKMLAEKHGFYAFESSLHVFAAQTTGAECGLDDWNSPNLWRRDYQGMADGVLFFAEDAFGGQFGIKSGQIYTFDPETGQLNYVANNLERWAQAVLDDYEVLTGYPLAHDWQGIHGPIPVGKRLVPKIPFVAGGEFSVSNVYVMESVEAMRSRASIAIQIKDFRDGQPIKLRVID